MSDKTSSPQKISESREADALKDISSPSNSKSLVDIRTSRENRTAEALRMKDEQIRILSDQNNKLLEAVDSAEEEISAIQLERLHIEEENRTLRNSNFNVQSKAQVADSELEKIRSEASDRDKQLKVMTAQNAELLRLLETEEANNAKLVSLCENTQIELRELKTKHSTLETASKSYEELANKSVREGQLQAEEIRLLRAEVESLKNQQNESTMKNSVELESLQEQLRVRKEKQYQLLEKLQSQEEARRRAEDEVLGMEEKIRDLHTKSSAAETQVQLEVSAKLSQEDLNRKLLCDTQTLSEENKELTAKLQKAEQAQNRLEVEARESGEQLREMAEKVFQLLERLKLAELGKTRSMEALRTKEQEVHVLKKKNSHLLKEGTKEGKARVKAELDKKVLEDQIRALKKHNSQLGQRCKEEAKTRVRAEDGKKISEDKIRTLNGRLSFLLNRIQTDEEGKEVQREDMVKMQNQLETLTDTCEKLQQHLTVADDNNKKICQKIGLKEEELQATKIKLDALQQLVDEQEEMRVHQRRKESSRKKENDENCLIAGGRLRFFIESKPTLGLVILKGKSVKDRDWLERKNCNMFLRKVFKSQNTEEMLLQKIAELYGILATQEEEIEKLQTDLRGRDTQLETLNKKIAFLHDRLGAEEDCKRRTLLRYVNAVKASVSLGEPGCEKNREEVGRVGSGRINLPEASLNDEEAHAIAAMLRGNETIVDLNLRGNNITDEGCRAIASILSGPSSLRTIDLRRNRIGRNGIKFVVEALECSNRVRHVYVHAGGKVEALGTEVGNGRHQWSGKPQSGNDSNANESTTPLSTVDTVCVVDIRENAEMKDSDTLREQLLGLPVTCGSGESSDANKEKLSLGSFINETNDEKERHSKGKKMTANSTKKISDEEREKKRQAKQVREAIKREYREREKGWTGRAGGLEVSTSKNLDDSVAQPIMFQKKRKQNNNGQQIMNQHPDQHKSLPPVRPNSAPGGTAKNSSSALSQSTDTTTQMMTHVSPFSQNLRKQKR